MLQDTTLRSLQALLPPGQVFSDEATLLTYEIDGGLDRGRPEAVVFPRTADEVAHVVRWAAQHAVPLVARGAGTGLSGGAVADRGGIIVEFARMNRILDLDTLGRSVVTQPAVINLRLDEQAKKHGLYFPPDPASQRASTIGGNVAENSGGPHCFKYGVTTNYITGLDIVLADGKQVRVGGRAMDYPEYDLCGLITGSEGMLALMTSISARLLRNPPGVKTMLAIFESVEQAANAVSAIIAAGLVPATLELMDQKITRIAEPYAHAGLPLDAGAILIIEIDGYPESLDTQLGEIEHLLTQQGVREIRIARTEEERYKIWLARKSVAGAITRLTPAYLTIDITVPRSCLRDILAQVDPICESYGLRVGHLLHAGDGNLHPMILIPDPRDEELMARVHAAGREMVKCCVEMGGSLTGEHGVGIEKRDYMTLMYTPDELLAMWDIKQAFDPHGLLNPGKVFPVPSDSALPYEGYHTLPTLPTDREPLPLPFAPATVEEAAQGFRVLAQAQQHISISNDEHQSSMRLSTRDLQGIKRYARDDLYITVGAGTPLEQVQDFLREQGTFLPLASPWPDATIGGLVAANVNAPLRMRYGSIRDIVLYATVVLPDGRIIRTGRPIVKNVAGFDLTKAFIGSRGTLGLLTDITLKFFPLPRAQHSLGVTTENLAHALAYIQALRPLALVASALLLYKEPGTNSYTISYTAEGLSEDVDAELSQVRTALSTAGATTITDLQTPGTETWTSLLADGIVVRIGVATKDVAAFLQAHSTLVQNERLVVDMSSGCMYAVKASDNAEEIGAWLSFLQRAASAYDGYVTVMHAPQEVRTLEALRYQPQALDIMKRLKQRWDPANILPTTNF